MSDVFQNLEKKSARVGFFLTNKLKELHNLLFCMFYLIADIIILNKF